MPRGVSKRHNRAFDRSSYLQGDEEEEEENSSAANDRDILAAAKLVAAQEALDERVRGHQQYDESSFALSDDEQEEEATDTNRNKQSSTAINVCRVLLLAIIVNSIIIGVKVKKWRKTKSPTGDKPESPTPMSRVTASPTLTPTERSTVSPTHQPAFGIFGVGVAVVVDNDDDDAAGSFGVVSDSKAPTSSKPIPAPRSFGTGST